ncbi:MAG: hypothetical protein SFU53_12985 [Terrimicrobiaceae bacterium]|nr:hypothetical protein [Terrimicrobiaceae bacterium]
MKYKPEKPHASLRSSLRTGERSSVEAGDPEPQVGEPDPSSLQKPGPPDPRVTESEADSGRTR